MPTDPDRIDVPVFAPLTKDGIMAMQRDIIRMLEGAVKCYNENDPVLTKVNEMRAAMARRRG